MGDILPRLWSCRPPINHLLSSKTDARIIGTHAFNQPVMCACPPGKKIVPTRIFLSKPVIGKGQPSKGNGQECN